MNTTREMLLKRLKYRSQYRGCKESEIICTKIFEEQAAQMSDKELLEFESLLNLHDFELLEKFFLLARKSLGRNI